MVVFAFVYFISCNYYYHIYYYSISAVTQQHSSPSHEENVFNIRLDQVVSLDHKGCIILQSYNQCVMVLISVQLSKVS